MPSLDSLDALLEDELKDIYDAEKQITKALPKIMKKATAPELKQALEEHLQQTEEQIERLDQVFEQLELKPRGKKCIGMQHLLKEGDEMMREADDEDTRDALIIAAAQKVEHYEIAAYGTLRTWANLLGHSEAAALFEETLNEEKETDQRLTTIAESTVNQEAADREGDEDREDAGALPLLAKAGQRGRSGGSARGGVRQMATDRGGSASGGKRGSRTSASGRSRSR